MRIPKNHDQQTGSSLIEVLVTVIITAIGLLGLAVLQNTGMKVSYDSYARTQAGFLASDLADRVRANPSVAAYTLAAGASGLTPEPCFATTAECTELQIQSFDLFHWQSNAQTILPGAEVSISLNPSSNLYTIRISWANRSSNEAVAGTAPADNEFEYHFRVTN